MVLDRINEEKEVREGKVVEFVERKTRITAAKDEKQHKVNDFESQKNNQKSNNNLLNTVSQWQRSGQIRGLKGRLGDLGSIDKRYDIAVSNAVGALDNLVFDTMDNASYTVRMLREHRVGNATCIAIDKIRFLENDLNKQFNTPENSRRLFD